MIEFLYNVGTGFLNCLPEWAFWYLGYGTKMLLTAALPAAPFYMTILFSYVFIYHSKFLREKKVLTYSVFVTPIVFVLMFFAAHMKEQKPRSGYGYGKARFQSYDVLPSASRRS